MSRQVVTYEHRLDATPGFAAGAGQTATPPEDKYKDRLLKYIPAEVVTLYLTLTALLGTATGLPWWLGWVVFAIGMVATWCYLRYPLEVRDFAQLIISCFAFGVWVFALGGPFKDLAWYKPIYGGLLLPTYTFFIAMVKTVPRPQA
jgi:hypothetical protein